MKWKWFLPLWLAVFLLAPSIWTHQLFMMQSAPPGMEVPGKPILVAFGAVHYFGDIVGELSRGGWGDAVAIFFLMILPILIYTFFVSIGIYYLGRYVLRKRQDRKKLKGLPAA